MLSISQQIFLQQMLKNEYLSRDAAIAKLKAIEEQLAINEQDYQPNLEKINDNFLKKTIRDINNKIKNQALQISIAKCEVTSEPMVILFSTTNNEITETQGFYTQQELAYWFPLMDKIIKSDTRSLNRISCLNLVSQKKLEIKLVDSEDFLDKCVKKGYLVLKAGQYYLGNKALLEFNNDLRTTYQDYLQICELCSELCCHGKACVNCNKQMHEHCLNTVLASSQECPLCNVRWGDFDFEQTQNSMASNDSSEDESEEIAEVSQEFVESARPTKRGTLARR